MSKHWYVLRSKPNKEMALWREASARGVECYYPFLHVQPVNPRSRKIRAYFPGYLFVQAELEQVSAFSFQWMPFSSGLVAFDEIPATVPDTLVQAIRRHVETLNAAGGEHLSGLKPGDAVIIQGGLFDGYEAILDARLAGSERVRVLLKLLQARQVNLDLPAAHIRKKTRR